MNRVLVLFTLFFISGFLILTTLSLPLDDTTLHDVSVLDKVTGNKIEDDKSFQNLQRETEHEEMKQLLRQNDEMQSENKSDLDNKGEDEKNAEVNEKLSDEEKNSEKDMPEEEGIKSKNGDVLEDSKDIEEDDGTEIMVPEKDYIEDDTPNVDYSDEDILVEEEDMLSKIGDVLFEEDSKDIEEDDGTEIMVPEKDFIEDGVEKRDPVKDFEVTFNELKDNIAELHDMVDLANGKFSPFEESVNGK